MLRMLPFTSVLAASALTSSTATFASTSSSLLGCCRPYWQQRTHALIELWCLILGGRSLHRHVEDGLSTAFLANLAGSSRQGNLSGLLPSTLSLCASPSSLPPWCGRAGWHPSAPPQHYEPDIYQDSAGDALDHHFSRWSLLGGLCRLAAMAASALGYAG